MDPIQTAHVRTSPTSDRPTSPLPPKSPSKPSAPSSFRRLFPRASVILTPKDVAALRDHPDNGSEGPVSPQGSNYQSHTATTPRLTTQHQSRPSTPTSSESGQARLAKLAGWQLADLAIQVVREVDARGGEKAGIGLALRHGCARALVVARERELERIASGGAGGLFSSGERDSEVKGGDNVDGGGGGGDTEADAENLQTHHTSHHTSASAPESAASSSTGPDTPPLPSPQESLPLIAAAKMKSMPLLTLNQLASDVEGEAERRYPDLGLVQSKKTRGSHGDSEELITSDGRSATRQDSTKSRGSKDGAEGGEKKEKHGKANWRDSRFWFGKGDDHHHQNHKDDKHKTHKDHHSKSKHGRHGSPLGPPYTRVSYHPNGRPRPRSMSAPHLPGLEPGGKGKGREGAHGGRGDVPLPTPPRSPTPIYEDEQLETNGNNNAYITQMANNLATNWRQTLESSIEIDSQSNNTDEPNAQTKEMINQLDDGQFWSLYADCVDEVARRKGVMAAEEQVDENEDGEAASDRDGRNGELNAEQEHPAPNSVFAKLSYGELVGLHAIVEAEAARRRAKDKPKRGGGAVMWDKEDSEGENNDEATGKKGKKRINGWSIASKQTIDLIGGDGGGGAGGDGADVLRNGIPSPPPRTVVPTTANGLLLPRPASSSASSASTLSFRNLKPKGVKSGDKTASTVAIWSSEVVKEDAEVEKILERFGTLERVRRGSGKSGGSGGDGTYNRRASNDAQKLISDNRASDAPTVEDIHNDVAAAREHQYHHAHMHLNEDLIEDSDTNVFTPSPQSPQAGLSPLRMADTLASDLSPLRMADSPGEGLSPLRMADSPNTVEVSLLQEAQEDEDKELDLSTSHGGTLALNPVPPPRVSSRKEKARPSASPPLPSSEHLHPHELRTPATGPVCPPTHIHPHRNRVRTALHSLSNTQLSLAARQVANEVRRRQRVEWGDGIEVARRGGSSGAAKGEMDLERLPMHRLELLARDIAEEAIRRGMAK